MQEIQFIAPAALHDEMLRLRNDKQMDFLESLTGMDWGVADEKDTPEKLRGLGVVYHLESTITGERIALKTATTNRELSGFLLLQGRSCCSEQAAKPYDTRGLLKSRTLLPLFYIE